MIDVIIATCDRPHLIGGLLSALHDQVLKPRRVVIVDSSDQPYVVSGDDHGFPVSVVSSPRKSLAFQKNLGLESSRLVRPQPRFVAFLDDDVVPGAEYLQDLVAFMESRGKSVLGCSGIDGHGRRPKGAIARVLLRGFLLDSARPGRVLRSGFNSSVESGDTPVAVEWLIGCSVWRWEVLEADQFRDDFRGSSLGEDVELSSRVGRKGELWVLPWVRFDHLLESTGRPDPFTHHFRLIRSRREISRIMKPSWLSSVGFAWGAFGQLIVTVLTTDWRRPHQSLWVKSAATRGLISGFCSALRNGPIR